MSGPSLRASTLWLLLLAAFAPRVAGAEPAVQSVSPAATNSGRTIVELVLEGESLDEVTELRFEPEDLRVIDFHSVADDPDRLAVTARATLTSMGRYDLVFAWEGGQRVLPDAFRIDPGGFDLVGTDEGGPPTSTAREAVKALSLLLVPFLLGVALGALSRRLRLPRVVVAVAGLGFFGGSVAVAFSLPDWSTWDIVSWGALAGLGLGFGALATATRRRLALSVAFGLLLLEVGARLVLPPIPQIVSPALDIQLRLRRGMHQPRCEIMFPELGRGWEERFGPLDREGDAHVFHIGDSMVQGRIAEGQGQPFVSLLDQWDPSVRHVNVGASSTSVDYLWLTSRRLIAWAPPRMVVLYLYQNDIYELGAAMPCCAGGPLLDVPDDGEGEPTLLCETPSADTSPRGLLVASPPPYPMRWLSQYSEVVRQLLYHMTRAAAAASYQLDLDDPSDWERQWRELRGLLRATVANARAAGVEVRVVVLPRRYELESAVFRGTPAVPESAQRLLDAVRAAGVEPLDPTDYLLEVVRNPPPDMWSGQTLGEIDEHYGPGGHRLIAEWLAPRLGIPLPAGDGE